MARRAYGKLQRPPIIALLSLVIAAAIAHVEATRVRNTTCTSQRLQAGQLLQFYCPNTLQASKTFHFNGSQIEPSEKYSLRASLLSFIIDEDDGGLYECNSTAQQTDHCLILTVVDEPGPPEITVNAHRHEVLVGRNLTLVCNAQMALFIYWYKDGRPIEDLSKQHYRTTRGITWPNSNLVVTSATREDAGIYSCEAINDLGKARATFNVTVKPVSYRKKWFHLVFDVQPDDPCALDTEKDYITGRQSPREIIKKTVPHLCKECNKLADLRHLVLANKNATACSDRSFIIRVYVFVDGRSTNLDLWKLYMTFGIRVWQGDFILPHSNPSKLRWRVSTFCVKERPEFRHNSICYKSRVRQIYRPTIRQSSTTNSVTLTPKGDIGVTKQNEQLETTATSSSTLQKTAPQATAAASTAANMHSRCHIIGVFLAILASHLPAMITHFWESA